jgi:CRP/FNR family cyclic AMP-dependent transcriptional regulator
MAQLTDDLARVPLFSGLNARQLRKLARGFREREYGAGSAIVRESHTGGVGFFVIAEGSASVEVAGKRIATLGPGDHFGELAMISRRARNATVIADETTRCLVIAFADFRAFVQDNGDVSWKLLEHLADLVSARRS